jgi:hypothetical protein
LSASKTAKAQLTSTPGAGAGNLISGNTLGGVELDNGSSNNFVQGNLIGTDKTDTTVLGTGDGILLYLSNNNTIGGTAAGAMNIIRDCSNHGVDVGAGTGNAILGNSIYATGEQGIQLDPQYSPNGGNDNQAAPALTGATLSGTSTTISGTLVGADNKTYRIEFFANQTPGPGGEDGQTYLGYTQVTTDGTGNASFTATGLAPAPTAQAYFTATATNLTTNDTSAFSADTSLLSVKANSLAVSGSNGAVVSNSGTFADGITGSTVTLTASIGTVVQNGNTWAWSETTPSGVAQTTPVTINATDNNGQTAAAEFWLNVGKVFVVTNTLDDGSAGSLRWAVNQVNADTTDTAAPADLIAFNIGAAGMHTIYLDSAPPTINNPVILDGTTEPGSQANSLALKGGAMAGDNGVWAVTLDGSTFGGGADGLTIGAGSSTVQGLMIQSFNNGIHLTTNGNDTIAGNYLTWPLTTGIFVDNVPNNTVGGTTPAARNVIGGGSSFLTNGAGVALEGAGATGNQVEGNYIGFDGTRPLYSPYGGGVYSFYDQTGVLIQEASGNLVGGTAPGAGNVIAAEVLGVHLYGGTSTTQVDGNLVQGNYIGTNPAGTELTTGLPGISYGVHIQRYASDNTIGGLDTNAPGQPLAGGGNVISGFSIDVALYAGSAVVPSPTGNVVEGNYIGTNAAGNAALAPNEYAQGDIGIQSWGHESDTTISGNLISGLGTAVALEENVQGSDKVQGNLIGTDATGTQPIPNGIGVQVSSNNNLIGGTTAGAGNIIAFNNGPAMDNIGTGNAIEGNSIYANNDVNGSTGLAIDNIGKNFNSGPTPGNLGNFQTNLGTTFIDTNWPGGPFTGTDNSYFSNLTLTQTGSTLYYSGTLYGLPNTRYLVTLNATSPGGTYFGSYYIYLTTGNDTGNGTGTASIPNQGFQAPSGFPNTQGTWTGSAQSYVAHSLGNHEQNFPVLTSASTSTSGTTVSGTLNGQATTTFRIEFFANAAPDATGYGQGQTYLGYTNVTTDASGNAAFTANGLAGLPAGQDYLSATATDPNGNTSEFSQDLDLLLTNPSVSQSGSSTTVGFTLRNVANSTYTINWGDPTDPQTIPAGQSNVSHMYTTAGIYTVQATAQNQGAAPAATGLVVVSTAANDQISASGGSAAGQITVNSGPPQSPTNLVVVSGSGGSDTFTVNFGNTLTTSLYLFGSGGDTFVANGAAGNNYFNKTPGQLTWVPQATAAPPVETIQYAGMQNQIIFGGSGNNYFNDPGSQNTTLVGGPGTNTFVLANTVGNGVVIKGGPSINNYVVNLGNLAGPITINNANSNATNNLTVNGAPGNNTIAFSGNQVTAGTQTVTVTTALASATINGGSGNNQITVGNLTIPVQNLAVNGGGGTNSITLVNLASSVTSLTVSGGPGTTQVQVQGSLPANVQEQNVPPLVSAGSGVQASEGVTWTGTGSFTDTTAGLTFTATVDYGDGTGTQPLTLNANHSFILRHAYAESGTYTVTVRVSDSQGRTGTGGFAATVADTVGLLLLDPSAQGALTVIGSASVTAQGEETIYLDSANAQAAVLFGTATASAEELDVVGRLGVQTSGSARLLAELNNGATAMADPLASLAVPAVPTTTFNTVLASGSTSLTLQPGTYNGGISVSGSASVTLTPGLYYLRGGGLSVSNSGTLIGSGVVIYNAPQSTSDSLSVSGAGSVTLSPPTSGTYAGITFFQARTSAAPVTVSGSGVLSLGGTLYAAGAAVNVSGSGVLNVQGNGATAFPARVIAYDLSDSTGGSVVIGTPLPIQQGQTATAGFWHGTSGQQLLSSFNGGSRATALGNWLAATFANVYGSGAESNNLTGMTNAQVAAYFQTLYASGSQGLAVQVLTTALNVYATTLILGGNAGVSYGFLVTYEGAGAALYNVGSSGASFGVANNSSLTVLQLLQAANSRARNGVLYNGDATLDAEALGVFGGVNLAGGIGS